MDDSTHTRDFLLHPAIQKKVDRLTRKTHEQGYRLACNISGHSLKILSDDYPDLEVNVESLPDWAALIESDSCDLRGQQMPGYQEIRTKAAQLIEWMDGDIAINDFIKGIDMGIEEDVDMVEKKVDALIIGLIHEAHKYGFTLVQGIKDHSILYLENGYPIFQVYTLEQWQQVAAFLRQHRG